MTKPDFSQPTRADGQETPYFLLWSLRQRCSLRDDLADQAAPDQVERRLKVLREASEAVVEDRVIDGVALDRATAHALRASNRATSKPGDLEELADRAQGFSLEDVLANYLALDEVGGGDGTLPCSTCLANVARRDRTLSNPADSDASARSEVDPVGSPLARTAGCYGLIPLPAGFDAWTEDGGDLMSVAEGRPGNEGRPEARGPAGGVTASFAAVSQQWLAHIDRAILARWLDQDGTGQHTDPAIWGFVGLWIESPLSEDRLALLDRWWDGVERHPSFRLERERANIASPITPWHDFAAAVRKARERSIPLDVRLAPPGEILGRQWTLAAHCPRCHVVAAPGQRFCPVCRRPGGPTPARRRLARGNRPFDRLTRRMPLPAVIDRLTRYHEAASVRRASLRPADLPEASPSGPEAETSIMASPPPNPARDPR